MPRSWVGISWASSISIISWMEPGITFSEQHNCSRATALEDSGFSLGSATSAPGNAVEAVVFCSESLVSMTSSSPLLL